MRAVSLFAFACLLAAPIAGEEGFSHEQNTYRFGGTYKMFSGESADECAVACELDGQCKAWSFQRETAGLGAARCELKRTIGPQEANPLMISGISPRLSNVGVALDGETASDEELLGAALEGAPSKLEFRLPLITSENRLIRIEAVDPLTAASAASTPIELRLDLSGAP